MKGSENTWAWLSPEWFYPSTFFSISWEYPFVLYLLALIPAFYVLRWLLNFRLMQKLDIALPRNAIRWKSPTWVRFIPDLIMTLVLVLIIVVLARSQRTNEHMDQWTEEIDIILAIDVTESMKIEDFKPNRLQAA